jgi:APA family basic amino acid/polyamine antiporter
MNLFRKKSIHDILQQVKEGDESVHGKLKKHLGVRDLTAFGIAAIIGAGIFSTIGKASADGGPAVILLFIFTALACSLAAFCYAEFSSMVPVSGSAYTYSYVSFGELFAWIIGWALIMEYAIGNIVVAISWSGYFSSLAHPFAHACTGISGWYPFARLVRYRLFFCKTGVRKCCCQSG